MKKFDGRLRWSDYIVVPVMVSVMTFVQYKTIELSLTGQLLNLFQQSSEFRLSILAVLVGAMLLLLGIGSLLGASWRLHHALRSSSDIDERVMRFAREQTLYSFFAVIGLVVGAVGFAALIRMSS